MLKSTRPSSGLFLGVFQQHVEPAGGGLHVSNVVLTLERAEDAGRGGRAPHTIRLNLGSYELVCARRRGGIYSSLLIAIAKSTQL